ncbi:hypothetical protein ACTQ45_12640 [Fundicoccus sp. Sow4_D5]|uniref:hypothetical protein n=1 Tax=unclassified Fundicoccus TaxID=2761543 RepID=UPI003F90EAC6|nr:hypothetical protein [Aerococcaceae bacterium DSM 111176]
MIAKPFWKLLLTVLALAGPGQDLILFVSSFSNSIYAQDLNSFMGYNMQQPWKDLLSNFDAQPNYNTEIMLQEARQLDFSHLAAEFQIILDGLLIAVPSGSRTKAYNDSFILSRQIDSVSSEEQVALNIIRTIDYHMTSSRLGPHIKNQWLSNIERFYNVNGSQYEQDIIFKLAKRTGLAPEAYSYTLIEATSPSAAHYLIETTFQDFVWWTSNYRYDYRSDELDVLGEGMIDFERSNRWYRISSEPDEVQPLNPGS